MSGLAEGAKDGPGAQILSRTSLPKSDLDLLEARPRRGPARHDDRVHRRFRSPGDCPSAPGQHEMNSTLAALKWALEKEQQRRQQPEHAGARSQTAPRCAAVVV